MAAAALIIGLGVSIVGTVMQVKAQQDAARAQKAALHFQQQAEEARQEAARLDAQRKKREVIRQSIIARSQALSGATNQGAQYGTALPGAYGQIQGLAGTNYSGITSALGSSAFVADANRQALNENKNAAQAGADAALGAGISSLGGAIGRSLGGIGKLGG